MSQQKSSLVAIWAVAIASALAVGQLDVPGYGARRPSGVPHRKARALRYLGNDNDDLARRRAQCEFDAGASVEETLGITPEQRAAIPIDHIIILVQENRAFDHYFGRMPEYGRTDVDGIPPDYTNRTPSGGVASPSHAATTCIRPDTPHSWTATHNAWNQGAMDGFYIEAAAGGQDGQRALAWYDETDLPFYYWLYSTYAMSDRFFCPVLGPTWPNRDYLYAATSDGVMNNTRAITVRNVFNALDDAGVSWGIYVDGTPRQNCIGFSRSTPGVYDIATFFADAAAGTLPQVVFLDGTGPLQDEHPTNDIQKAEDWVRSIYLAVTSSPLWPTTAFFFTYDEGGGFFDHVPPPTTCPPTRDDETVRNFSQLGVRIPSVVISPYSKPGYVSHVAHETTSITRFIEVLFDLPALTARDANTDALLDLFDFTNPAFLDPPPDPPAAGTGGCR